MKKTLAILALTLAAACAPLTQVGDRWQGQPLDALIVAHGPGVESYLDSGGRVVEWESFEGSYEFGRWCTVRVLTDPSGQIIGVAQSQSLQCASWLRTF